MTDKIRLAELTGEEPRQILTGQAVTLLPMGSPEDREARAAMGDDRAAAAVAMDRAHAQRTRGCPGS